MKRYIKIALFTAIFLPVPLYAATWNTSLNQTKIWQAIASSADGSKIFAAAYNGNIFTSTDGGANWIEVLDTTHEWQDITISDDGSVGAAIAANGGDVYVSKDSGATWGLTSAGQRGWTSIASSDDGDVLVAAANDGTVHISRDLGDTWSMSTTTAGAFFVFVDISDNGQKMISTTYPTGRILTSVDGGGTWTPHDSLGEAKWTSVSISADGEKFLAARADGTVFVSTDGVSWQEKGKVGGELWWVKISSNEIFTGTLLGSIYRSTDGGATWTDTSSGMKNWLDIAVSGNGKKIVGATYEGFLYTYTEEAETPVEETATTTEPVIEEEEETATTTEIAAEQPQTESQPEEPVKKVRRRSGGGGSIKRTPKTVTPVVVPVPVATPVIAYAAPVVRTVAVAAPQRDLDVEMTGEDVKKLQEVLITQEVGENTENLAAIGATGYFGNITRNALAEFQKKVGLPAYGYFGEKTKAAFEALGIVWW